MFTDAPIERFSFNFAVEGDEITSNIAMNDSNPARNDDNHAMNDTDMADDSNAFIPGKEHFITECNLASQSSVSEADSSMSTEKSFIRSINDGECKLTNDTVTFCAGVSFLRPSVNQRPTNIADHLIDSDLTKHVYEGGLKLWECAIDLIQFLHDQSLNPSASLSPIHDQSISLDYGHVLDLGCGHGFTGLYPLIYNQTANQDINVTFQDLNSDVLIESTMNHALLNVANAFNLSTDQSIQLINERCCFISGDWCSPSLMDCLLSRQSTNQNHPSIEQKFSLILTSDTLYEPSVLNTLLQVIDQSLHVDGVALVAAKRYYFGIGGGTVALMARVQQIGRMEARVERVIEDGKSNIREIVSLRWKKI